MAIWWNEARGKYEYDWEDAAKVRHRGYARTKGEAERLRAGKMVEASKATELLGDPEQTVANFANQWLKRVKNSGLKRSTIDSYSRLSNRHIAAAIGPIRLRDLRRTHIKEFLNAKREQISATDSRKIQFGLSARLFR
jgi:Phage integrase, N-terminal SAM-like domain